MPGVDRHGTGSEPQLAFPNGADVIPRGAPKSKIWKRSPAWNVSVTVRIAPTAGATNVQRGASRKVVGVPELGMQKGPAGSAGSQPVAGIPAVVNANSWNIPSAIGPAVA